MRLPSRRIATTPAGATVLSRSVAPAFISVREQLRIRTLAIKPKQHQIERQLGYERRLKFIRLLLDVGYAKAKKQFEDGVSDTNAIRFIRTAFERGEINITLQGESN